MKFEGDDQDDHLKRNDRTKNRPHINYEVPDPEDRQEKPWQRVNNTPFINTVPSYFIILVLGFYLLLAYSTQRVEDDMPRPVMDADLNKDVSNIAFSEETALQYLYTIMGDRPRVAGTEYHLQQTEVVRDLLLNATRDATVPVTVLWQTASGESPFFALLYTMMGDRPRVAGTEYHLQQTEVLRDLLLNATRDATLPVTVLWQTASGAFKLDHEIPYLAWYYNASNIAALLEGESGVRANGELGTTLLLNCHYDSVPFALGASDNVAFCAILAEILHRVAQRTTKFKHNLIFLFNGAEESGLLGSHAFLQHPWARNITAVVNLDAAGMNGKANVFQTLDSRLVRAYAKSTNRPSAQSFGEFLFGSGLVPSDTDFRIWRDYGQFYGIDIAFTKWGNVYHTRNDNPTNLQPGVLQAAGDMLLNLVNNMADMPELAEKAEPTTMVYYDYLNSFMIAYPLWAAYLVDALVAVVALISVGYYVFLVGVRKSTFRGLGWAVLGRLLSTLAAIGAGLAFVLITSATTTQLRYLSHQWITVPIYWIPYVLVAMITSQLYDAWSSKKSGLNRSFRALQASAATRTILAVLLLAMTCVPSLTTMRYVIAVPLFLMSVFSVIPLMLVRYLRVPAWQQLFVEMLVSVPAMMFLFTLCLRINSLMLPVMGRSASNTPDFLVGLLNLGLVALVTSAVRCGKRSLFYGKFKVLLVPVLVLMFLFTLCLRINSLMLPVMGRSASNTPDFLVGLLNLGLAALVTSAVFKVLLVSVPVLMFLFTLCLRINSLMLPVMGRSASNTPDFLVGLLNLGLAALVTSAVSGIELLFSRKRLWLPTAVAGLAALIIMFLPLEPYDAAGTGLQRHYWFHTEIINHTVTPPTSISGVTVTKIDTYTIDRMRRALADSGLNYTVKADLAEDCAQYIFCNLPMFRTRLPNSYAEALFIEMPPPTAFATMPSLRLESRLCSGTNCTLHFAFDGPAHNTLTLWPRSGSIVAWSYDAPTDPSFTQNDRPAYTIVQASATYSDPFDTQYFWITLEVPVAQQSRPLLDLAQHAHKKQHPELYTRDYQQLLDAAPDYFNIDTSLSIRNNYAF
ncbi:endoplasmic reticulum metallopeptidase 1-like [Cydia amplana]|uniref:endoplasmic reticulum metallopeptidase 1-like n=1 Tax=Cydia amplana TaxID=1869771 RepID=UPI002FE52021